MSIPSSLLLFQSALQGGVTHYLNCEESFLGRRVSPLGGTRLPVFSSSQDGTSREIPVSLDDCFNSLIAKEMTAVPLGCL